MWVLHEQGLQNKTLNLSQRYFFSDSGKESPIFIPFKVEKIESDFFCYNINTIKYDAKVIKGLG